MVDLKNCRVRFAPSPTGFLHIGGARTALFNYLLARKNNGAFILRIEDTDRERYVDNSVQQIIDSLKWLGIEWDEGPDCGGSFKPYYQSQRLNYYKKYADELLANGSAYYCFCSAERLDKMREEQKEKGLSTQYDMRCRNLKDNEIKKNIDAGLPFVIRMKTPVSGEISFEDIIREKVTIPFENIDDQILIKSDGFPTYHLANVVDDHLMKITLVLRGEEWLMSTAKHLLLYQAFGWKSPEFGHLPLLLNSDRSKLSKRQGDVSVSDYRDKGFLPESVINFIALLGWNSGDDREIFSKKELIELFTLDRCGKSGSVFDIVKLKWMNGIYIREMKKNNPAQLAEKMRPLLIDKNYIDEEFPADRLKLFAELIGDVIETFIDIFKYADSLFSEKIIFQDSEAEAISKTDLYSLIKKSLILELEKIDSLTKENLNAVIKNVQTAAGIKGKELYKTLRVIISGETEGRDLALMFLFLNKHGILKRLNTN